MNANHLTPHLSLMSGAEPFFFEGGRVGALCLHGLTASPQEVYWLGKHLAAHGLTVYGPRLSAHGTRFEDLRTTRWQDWYFSALDGYHLLRQRCERIFILGLSMGGMLTLLLGAEQASPTLAGLVVMASPIYFDRKDLMLTHTLRHVNDTVVVFDKDNDPLYQRVLKRQVEQGDPPVGRVAYYKHSATGISELLYLQEVIKPRLPNITARTLLIYSEKDTAVPIGNIDVLRDGLIGVPQLETVRLTESEHVLTLDIECDAVFDHAWAFIQRGLSS